uniref:Uncharacterized protein n=1 Tax=Physcomitrium patens TaxID=3218 RepID=A0A7I4F9W2_PHYPA
MLRTAGRSLSRVLHTTVAQRTHGIPPVPVPAAGVLSSRRWFNASGFSLSGHAASGQLDEFGIATGAEREELEYQRQGKKRFDLDPPRGPFGTKLPQSSNQTTMNGLLDVQEALVRMNMM